MQIKESIGTKIFRIFNITFMFILMFIMFYPMLHIAMASVSDASLLMAHRGLLLRPLGQFTLNAYQMVFKNPMIIRGYMNTIYIVVAGVTINVILTSMGAYFLSRKNVFWKKYIMFFIVFTMFFSGGLIPFYFTVKEMKLDNSLWALIIPTAISTFNLIIMRTSFMTIPESLEESAKLDGAGHWRILFQIVLPLSLPVIAVMILYYTVDKWNSWFHASIFIRERTLLPLQIILREILIQNNTSSMTGGVSAGDQESIGEAVKFAVIMVASLPILTIYPFLQKYFVKGVMIGAVKG